MGSEKNHLESICAPGQTKALTNCFFHILEKLSSKNNPSFEAAQGLGYRRIANTPGQKLKPVRTYFFFHAEDSDMFYMKQIHSFMNLSLCVLRKTLLLLYDFILLIIKLHSCIFSCVISWNLQQCLTFQKSLYILNNRQATTTGSPVQYSYPLQLHLSNVLFMEKMAS